MSPGTDRTILIQNRKQTKPLSAGRAALSIHGGGVREWRPGRGVEVNLPWSKL
jgi:hypothetical protein